MGKAVLFAWSFMLFFGPILSKAINNRSQTTDIQYDGASPGNVTLNNILLSNTINSTNELPPATSSDENGALNLKSNEVLYIALFLTLLFVIVIISTICSVLWCIQWRANMKVIRRAGIQPPGDHDGDQADGTNFKKRTFMQVLLCLDDNKSSNADSAESIASIPAYATTRLQTPQNGTPNEGVNPHPPRCCNHQQFHSQGEWSSNPQVTWSCHSLCSDQCVQTRPVQLTGITRTQSRGAWSRTSLCSDRCSLRGDVPVCRNGSIGLKSSHPRPVSFPYAQAPLNNIPDSRDFRHASPRRSVTERIPRGCLTCGGYADVWNTSSECCHREQGSKTSLCTGRRRSMTCDSSCCLKNHNRPSYTQRSVSSPGCINKFGSIRASNRHISELSPTTNFPNTTLRPNLGFRVSGRASQTKASADQNPRPSTPRTIRSSKSLSLCCRVGDETYSRRQCYCYDCVKHKLKTDQHLRSTKYIPSHRSQFDCRSMNPGLSKIPKRALSSPNFIRMGSTLKRELPGSGLFATEPGTGSSNRIPQSSKNDHTWSETDCQTFSTDTDPTFYHTYPSSAQTGVTQAPLNNSFDLPSTPENEEMSGFSDNSTDDSSDEYTTGEYCNAEVEDYNRASLTPRLSWSSSEEDDKTYIFPETCSPSEALLSSADKTSNDAPGGNMIDKKLGNGHLKSYEPLQQQPNKEPETPFTYTYTPLHSLERTVPKSIVTHT